MTPRIAVLSFPGNNCENETKRALENVGFIAEKVRWNQPQEYLLSFDGVIIPGGFSFEDRGRSGVISAQEPIFQTLKTMAKNGTPILGICNGAQMLVESGLILETPENIPALSLLPNKRMDDTGNIIGTGYYHAWVHMKPTHQKTPFSHFTSSISVPVAHGEGRFTIPEVLQSSVQEKCLIVFKYVDEEESANPHYPTNPNGSFANAAALCNPAGNVVAMMPHPERAKDGKKVFESLWEYFQQPYALLQENIVVPSFEKRILKNNEPYDIELLVQLNITDNTEATFAKVLSTDLARYEWWGIKLAPEMIEQSAEEIIQSHEILNLHKQSVMIKINKKWHIFSKEKGFQPANIEDMVKKSFLVREKEDFKGKYTTHRIQKLFPEKNIHTVASGVVWHLESMPIDEATQNPIFASYVGEEIFSL